MTLLVVLIAGFLLLTTYISSSRSIRELSEKIIFHSAEQTETELKRFFQPIYGILRLAREWGETEVVYPDDLKLFNSVFIPILNRFPHISSINTGDPNGNGLMLLRDKSGWLNRETRPAEWGNKVRWTRLAQDQTEIESWWEQSAYDPRERPWYQEAIQLKERQSQSQRQTEYLAWTKPYHFLTTKDLGVTASTWINYSGNENSFYVLAFDITISAITEFTTHLDISKNGKAFVVSDNGMMLGLPKDKKFNTEDKIKKALGVPISEIDIPIVQELLNYANENPFGDYHHVRLISNNTVWWGGARPYFLGPQQRIWIVVAAPEDDFFGDIKHRRNMILIISLSALILAFFMANFLARKFSQPINDLVRESDKIRKLNIDSAISIQSQIKEVNELADAQQKMRAALKSFSTYIPTEVVKELVARGEAAKIGGKTENLTVMFTDIADFTSIAETLEPEKLTAHMADYFEALLEILSEEKATVDKFIGDSIVAFWGAPVPNPDHAASACRTALRLRDKVHQLNEKWKKEGKPQLRTRFGIATGPVLVGNVGASHRLNYTVLGDTVNLASRLEGINKNYGTEILACKPVKEAAASGFEWKFIDSVAVKGKSQKVDLFELVGLNH